MKIRNYGFLAAIALSVLAIASCKKEKEAGETEIITVSPNTIEAPGTSKESYTLNVVTSELWAAEASDFITVDPSWGTGSASVKVTVAKNNTDVPRVGEITFKVEGKGEVVVTVNQTEGIIEELGHRKFYVKVDGSAEADGRTWATATTWEKAYDEAVEGETIHFAAGTYVPSTLVPATDESKPGNVSFVVLKNVNIIGGYPADATSAAAIYDPVKNVTVLSGALSEEVTAYHVMVIGGPVSEEGKIVTVKGLTFSNGNGTGCESPVINGANLQAGRAGAVAVSGKTNVTFEDCTFSNNKAKEAGAVQVFGNNIGNEKLCAAVFKNCAFFGNVAEGSNSGAMGVTKSVVYVYDCTFDSNTTTNNAGAVMVDGHWSQTSGDQAWFYAFNSTFSNNVSGQVGSAVYGIWGDHMALVNCTFANNSSTGNGAAISGHYAEIDVVNCTITGNTGKWGGICAKQPAANCVIKVYNSVIAGNTEGMDICKENDAAADVAVYSSIAGANIYSAAGAPSACSFAPATMFGTLADNGGKTQTIALVGTDNPAVTGGLDAAAIAKVVVDTIVPADDQALAQKDQRGASRTGKHMGACSK